jgi:hypothetical protein
MNTQIICCCFIILMLARARNAALQGRPLFKTGAASVACKAVSCDCFFTEIFSSKPTTKYKEIHDTRSLVVVGNLLERREQAASAHTEKYEI